jgi:hypothetical protein
VVVKSGEKKNLQIRTTRFKIARFNLYLLSFLSYNLERQSMKNVLAHKHKWPTSHMQQTLTLGRGKLCCPTKIHREEKKIIN